VNGPHPHEFGLALYASNDTGWWRRRSLSKHLRVCGECREKLTQFEALRGNLASMAETPPNVNWESLNWESLAAEMRANIRLGLEAGACVRTVPARRRMNPRLAVAFASLLVVVAASFLLRGSRVLIPEATSLSSSASMSSSAVSQPAAEAGETASTGSGPITPVLEANEDGLALRTGPASMTLLGREGSTISQSASAQGEIRARYVDGNTGVVTINNVYLQ
jgi:hypothetical protein